MTNSYLFLKNKVQRRIDWGGETYVFTRSVEDKYHRETETLEFSIKGLYHQSSAYQQKTSADGAVTVNKPQPMILAMFEDGQQVQKGDKITLNGKTMIVTGIINVQQLDVALQISLEGEE